MFEDDFFPNSSSEDQRGYGDLADFSDKEDNFSNHYNTYNQDYQTDTIGGLSEEDFTNINIGGKSFRLGYKAVGIILALVLVFIGFLMLVIGSIKVVKVDNTQSTPTSQGQLQDNTDVSSTTGTSSQIDESSSSGTSNTVIQSTDGFISVPDNMQVDYSSSVLTVTGTVSKLPRYLQSNQVVYCVEVNTSIGVFNYYCGYNTYRQLGIGDTVTVEYQQVSNTCFSVLTLRK